MNKLTSKQLRFIDEFLIDGNATRSYVAAGYSPKLAHTAASKLLQNSRIAELIKEKQEQVSKKLEVTRESIIQDLLDIKNNTKATSPQHAIKAIEVISKMLGFDQGQIEEVKDDKEIKITIHTKNGNTSN